MAVRPLPNALQLIAEQELNEVPNRTDDDINTIRKWLECQPHLKSRTDEQWILTFLRGCKFGLERTKEKLEQFYSMRTIATDFFKNRDPFAEELQYYLTNNIFVVAPINEGEPVRIIVRLGSCDPKISASEAVIKLFFMFLDIVLEETDNCQISGLIVILDFKDFAYKHILKTTPNSLRNGIISLKNAYPIHFKSLVIINMPTVAIPIYKFLKTFFSKKLSDRILAFEDNGGHELYTHIPFAVLPKEYGGNGGSFSELKEQWKLKVESYKDWFKNDENFFSDKLQRPQNPEPNNDLFGTDGSFRQLNID